MILNSSSWNLHLTFLQLEVTNEVSSDPITTMSPELESTTLDSHIDSVEELIWSEEFSSLNLDTWTHLVTAWDGGNREFQYYRNDRKNRLVTLIITVLVQKYWVFLSCSSDSCH